MPGSGRSLAAKFLFFLHFVAQALRIFDFTLTRRVNCFLFTGLRIAFSATSVATAQAVPAPDLPTL